MPNTVKFGFTGGIAVFMASQQLKDFFGLTVTGATASWVKWNFYGPQKTPGNLTNAPLESLQALS